MAEVGKLESKVLYGRSGGSLAWEVCSYCLGSVCVRKLAACLVTSGLGRVQRQISFAYA